MVGWVLRLEPYGRGGVLGMTDESPESEIPPAMALQPGVRALAVVLEASRR